MPAAPAREQMRMDASLLRLMRTAMTMLPALLMNANPVREQMQTGACSLRTSTVAMMAFSAPQMHAILQGKAPMQMDVYLLR